MDVTELKNQVDEMQLKQEAAEACLAYLESKKDALPSDWKLSGLQAEFNTISLVIAYAFQLEPYYSTEYILFYEGEGEVGRFVKEKSISGETDFEYILLNEQIKI